MATGSTTTIVSVVGPIPEALNGIGGARASTDIAEWAPKGAVGAEANGAQGAGVAAAVAVAAKNQVGATSIDRIISKLRLRWRLYACLYVRISAAHIRLSRGFELDYKKRFIRHVPGILGLGPWCFTCESGKTEIEIARFLF